MVVELVEPVDRSVIVELKMDQDGPREKKHEKRQEKVRQTATQQREQSHWQHRQETHRMETTEKQTATAGDAGVRRGVTGPGTTHPKRDLLTGRML